MPTINPDLTGIVDGQVGFAASWITPFQTIINLLNGALDVNNFAANGTDLATIAAPTQWLTWAPAAQGFTGAVNVSVARYQQLGKTVICRLETDGTSNATTFTFTLPTNAKSNGRAAIVSVQDNGGTYLPGLISTTAGSNVASVIKDLAGDAFTASGGKSVDGLFVYEAA